MDTGLSGNSLNRIRRPVLIILIMLWGYAAYGQEDLMLNTIRNREWHEDTAKVNQWSGMAERYLASNLDSAYGLLQNAFVLSEKRKMEESSARILSLLATYYLRRGEIDKSNSLLQMAIRRAEKLSDKKLLVYLHNGAGLAYLQQEEPSLGIIHFFKAQQLVSRYHLQNTVHAVETYNNLGSLWLDLKEWGQALKMLDLAENNIRGADKYASRAYILTNKGLAYWRRDTALALQNFLDALTMVRKAGDEYAAHTILINISTLYMEAGDFTEAFHYLHEARRAARALGSDAVLAVTEGQTGLLYCKTKDYRKAEKHLNNALRLASRTGGKMVVRGVHRALAELYVATGRFEDAYRNQEYYVAYLDSLQDTEKGKTVDLALKYQAAEKDKEIAQQQLQLSLKENLLRRKDIWIGVTVGGAALLLLLLALVNRNYRSKRKLAMERIHNYAQQQEIGKLKAMADGEEKERSRIAYDLHDGVMVRFATVKMQLNTLFEAYPGFGSDERCRQILNQFDQAAGELRRTAHNLMPDLLLEEGLLQALFYFCKAMEETTGLRIAFQPYGTFPRFRPDFEIALYRIVQELLQNIVKHARAGEAVVQLSHDENLLSVTIEDNGRGFEVDKAVNGMGLTGVRNRVRIFGGIFDLQSMPGSGTTIFLEFDTNTLSP